MEVIAAFLRDGFAAAAGRFLRSIIKRGSRYSNVTDLYGFGRTRNFVRKFVNVFLA